MSDGHRRLKHPPGTGTVPKIKYRNNTARASINERDDSPGSWSGSNNILQPSDIQRLNLSSDRFVRRHPNYLAMDAIVVEEAAANGHLVHANLNANNGSSVTTTSTNTSSSTASRKNSMGTVPKCDNIAKYPDKRQIEDKLNQIREYLQITTNLMSSMKHTDLDHHHQHIIDQAERLNLSQMIKDLKDSEAKLVGILQHMSETAAATANDTQQQAPESSIDNYSDASSSNRNDLIDKIDHTNREIDYLRDQQISMLKEKAENKLKDARQIQDKLMMAQFDFSRRSADNTGDKNVIVEREFDAAINELEERTRRLKEPPRTSNLQDKLLGEVDSLHNQIVNLHKVNDDRTQLIQILDNRDTDLRAQHVELQQKLCELQNKKIQVDRLASQLHGMDEVEEGDVGLQVKRIVTMKDQLSKLKDMLEIVKTTQPLVENTNCTQEEQAIANEIFTKTENFLQNNDGDKARSVPLNQSTQNIGGGGGNLASLNDNCHKQINKNAYDRQLALQNELEVKKRELEAIMGKHKASTSNLNHDVGNDNKSEYSCGSSAACWPPQSGQNRGQDSSDKYSSDECADEVNDDDNDDYADLNLSSSNHHHNQSMPLPNSVNYPDKCRSRQNSSNDYVHSYEYDRLSSIGRTPERNTSSETRSASNHRGDRRGRSNNLEDTHKNQVQKQLELIKSVCDSMLDQQNPQKQQQQQHQSVNVQQLRNNLTPSSTLYAEPRFASPNPHAMNALQNVLQNPLLIDGNNHQWLPTNNLNNNNNNNNNHNNNNSNNSNLDAQNWLTTSTLPTQAFMLNTLNQCCQMLWLQQRELITLRQAVNQLQERYDNNNPDITHSSSSRPFDNDNNPVLQLNPIESNRRSNQIKINPQSVSAACSMPNLNQYNNIPPPVINVDQNYHQNQQQQSARLLDSCLNNVVHQQNDCQQQEHLPVINNSLLHGVNANINLLHQQQQQNLPPSQIWNGQALNNQVAPGNRANNYWDNFRSYSRQNLLSTKSNDGVQNLAATTLERSNLDRTNPFTLMSLTKSSCAEDVSRNMSSQDRRPITIRHASASASRNRNNSTSGIIPPPDVLNINPNKTIEQPVVNNNNTSNESNESHLNNYQLFAYHNETTSSNNSTLSEDLIFKDCIPDNNTRRRNNDWTMDDHLLRQQQQPPPNDEQHNQNKSKLFEELRDNVYKEVATLISANEARPHFLIQLFRDLQMISSDPLRLKILQSIQAVVTHSLIPSVAAPIINRQNSVAQQTINEQDLSQMVSDCFSLQSTVWSKSSTVNNNSSTVAPRNLDNIDGSSDLQNALKIIIPFLNDHENEIIQHNFLGALKQMLIDSESFQETVKDTVFQKHFSNVLDEVLAQYLGKKVHDVKMHLIQTINDLLRGELSFIQLIQETCPSEKYTELTAHGRKLSAIPPLINEPIIDSQLPNGQIENGDLAEADQQGRVNGEEIDIEVVDEEGAVGGFWEMAQQEPQQSSGVGILLAAVQPNPNDESLDAAGSLEYQSNVESQNQFISKQGMLDQVPTRLPTKSRSNTPSKDRSGSSRSGAD